MIACNPQGSWVPDRSPPRKAARSVPISAVPRPARLHAPSPSPESRLDFDVSKSLVLERAFPCSCPWLSPLFGDVAFPSQ